MPKGGMGMSIVTEREWLRQAARARGAKPRCWGAQCVVSRRQTLKDDKAFRALLLLTSLVTALAMPWLQPAPKAPAVYPTASVARVESRPSVRTVREVAYAAPVGLLYQQHTYTREQLLRGKLLLIDTAHPLPAGAPAPNTLSIAAYGKGMVPVSDLSVKSGRETIAALSRLFAYARGRGVSGLSVWRGTLSPAEQGELRLATLRALATGMSMSDAALRALDETDAPCSGELQQEYTVEIRLGQKGESAPDERALGLTEQGRFLIQNAWRYGFIHRDPQGAGARRFRFRYVGEAHATAMTYLGLGLEEYLALLHDKRVLSVSVEGAPKYLILCAPMELTHIEFAVPKGAVCEASLDNTGWAVLACTLPETEP